MMAVMWWLEMHAAFWLGATARPAQPARPTAEVIDLAAERARRRPAARAS